MQYTFIPRAQTPPCDIGLHTRQRARRVPPLLCPIPRRAHPTSTNPCHTPLPFSVIRGHDTILVRLVFLHIVTLFSLLRAVAEAMLSIAAVARNRHDSHFGTRAHAAEVIHATVPTQLTQMGVGASAEDTDPCSLSRHAAVSLQRSRRRRRPVHPCIHGVVLCLLIGL